MKILEMKFWTVSDVKHYREYLFIFGDNNIGKGCGGQAVIRYEKNSIGIPTKKFPSNNEASFYTDDEYSNNCINIRNAIEKIIVELNTKKYKGVIFPADGLGTGLANLPLKAPKTFEFLLQEIMRLKKIINDF